MRRRNDARSAEAALEGVMFFERRLQRRQTILKREALDSDYFRALGLYREHQTGSHRGTVDQHGARTAYAVLAADMRSGQPQAMAQAIRQRQPRLDFDLDGPAVDLKSYGHVGDRYAAAARSARSTMTPISALR